MKVILLHNVKKIGKQGEIKEVADGYANGFLIPKRLAKPATPDAVKQLLHTQNKVEEASDAQKKDESKLFKKINKKHIAIKAKSNGAGGLFAAIDAKSVAISVQNELGVIVEENHIVLKDGIKELGEYEVPIQIGDNNGLIIATVEEA